MNSSSTTLRSSAVARLCTPKSGNSGWQWPSWRDPRFPFAAVLTCYAILGLTFFGFNRNPLQMCMMVASGCVLDMALAWLVKRQRLVPLSAYITCCSLVLLLNFAHSSWLLFLPVYLSIGSKYVLTYQGRHVFNPSLFGVAVSLLITHELITAAPAYQWAGGHITMSAGLVTMALVLFVYRIGRTPLMLSFLCLYALQTALRAWMLRHHLPPSMLFLGTVMAPSFFLFTFYMLTDPATSPRTASGQVGLAFVLTVVDLYLHTKESVYTLFYAALTCAAGKFLGLHAREIWQRGPHAYLRSLFIPQRFVAVGWVGGLGLVLLVGYQTVFRPHISLQALGFQMESLPPEHTGIRSKMGPLLQQVDPRLTHIAKWILSVGDAVAVGDVDNDGRLDLFLTNVLKRPGDRHALYRNLGNMRFARVSMPALGIYREGFRTHGLPSGATFVDYDGDGDQDLALAVGFGPSRLLRNLLVETGTVHFVDATTAAGIDEHTVSLAVTFFDLDRDHHLDMLVTNALSPYLPGYDTPVPLNVFALPEPAYDGDRRMLRFMHNGWHNADNGGLNVVYRNRGDGTFERVDAQQLGMPETRWSLAVATGDINRDGWTDLYVANDFGPDDVYLNQQGSRFVRVQGRMFGQIGKDTYKGMNSTLADFDRNGWLDIYVSNVHHALQAEGSLLWMTRPGPDPFVPAFTDEAMQRGALNERRFGWGAAAGDLNNDGWVDIVQVNGMVDDRSDPIEAANKDYWYINHKLMQSGPEIHTYADMWGDIRGRTIYPNEARRVYLNQGAHGRAVFVDVAPAAGVADPDNSRGVALADLDNDGDLDLVITNQHGPVSIYRNSLRPDASAPSPTTNFIGLQLEGNGRTTSRAAVGTQVVVRYELDGREVEQLREVTLLGGFSAQTDPRLHFGIGSHSGSVSVTVRWYGGETETLQLDANRYHVVRQPR